MGSKVQPLVHAEISVIPITVNENASSDTASAGMSKHISKVFDAIRRIKDVNTILTPMGTQIESSKFENILKAIDAAHYSLRTEGSVKRIISSIRIDERLDKSTTLQDKVRSVKEKL
jgi:uncharacterized protein (TIGR00106 family)